MMGNRTAERLGRRMPAGRRRLPAAWGAVFVVGLLLLPTIGHAAEALRLAVAGNFAPTARVIAAAWERESGETVVIVSGATGRLFAQIRHGAPFDGFLAADEERPARLVAEGRAVADSRFTYALGRLALIGRGLAEADTAVSRLRAGDFQRLAIANPRLAPYGRAAETALRRLGLWESMAGRLIMGENVSQALQFVTTGNAELGLVAWAQARTVDGDDGMGVRLVPEDLHEPIRQDAVIVRDGPAIRGFWRFLRSDEARRIIREAGYAILEEGQQS